MKRVAFDLCIFAIATVSFVEVVALEGCKSIPGDTAKTLADEAAQVACATTKLLDGQDPVAVAIACYGSEAAVEVVKAIADGQKLAVAHDRMATLPRRKFE